MNALQKAIEQVEAGNFLILIDGQDGKQNLLGWLKELQELREQQAVHKRQQYMESLTCFYGLTEDEAKKVYARIAAGLEIEYDEGPCRPCKGTGRVDRVVRETSWGAQSERENCLTCSGTGVDKKRIMVPT